MIWMYFSVANMRLFTCSLGLGLTPAVLLTALTVVPVYATSKFCTDPYQQRSKLLGGMVTPACVHLDIHVHLCYAVGMLVRYRPSILQQAAMMVLVDVHARWTQAQCV